MGLGSPSASGYCFTLMERSGEAWNALGKRETRELELSEGRSASHFIDSRKTQPLTPPSPGSPARKDSQPAPLFHSVSLSLRSEPEELEGPSCLAPEVQRRKGASPRSHSSQWRSVVSAVRFRAPGPVLLVVGVWGLAQWGTCRHLNFSLSEHLHQGSQAEFPLPGYPVKWCGKTGRGGRGFCRPRMLALLPPGTEEALPFDQVPRIGLRTRP